MAPKDRKALCLAGLVVALKVKQDNKKKRRFWSNKFLLQREELSYSNLHNEPRLEPRVLYEHLKMDEAAYLELLSLVTPLIERVDTAMRKAISPAERLYATLLYLSTGQTYKELQNATRISTQSLGAIIPDTCQAICKVLKDSYMKLPTSEEEWKQIAEEFERKSQFPNCLGVIDARHIRIAPPAGSGSFYLNYKSFNSLVMLCIVNANYEFILFHIDKKTRSFDGDILECTDFGDSLVKNNLPLPKDKRPNPSSFELPYVFVADEAFPSLPNLVKQFPSDDSCFGHLVYNYRLSRVQAIAENAFGILSERFNIFRTNICLTVHRTDLVLTTCAYLHNFFSKKCPLSYTPEGSFCLEDADKYEINSLIKLKRGQCQKGGDKAIQTQYSFMNYFCNDSKLEH